MNNNIIKTKKYIVKQNKLSEYIKAYHILNALENGGVDNWNYYCQSKIDYLDDSGFDSFDDIVEHDLKNFNVLVGDLY